MNKPFSAASFAVAAALSLLACGSEAAAPVASDESAMTPAQTQQPQGGNATGAAGARSTSPGAPVMTQQAGTGGAAANGGDATAGTSGAAANGGSGDAAPGTAANGGSSDDAGSAAAANGGSSGDAPGASGAAAAGGSSEDAGVGADAAGPVEPSREPLSGRMYAITAEYVAEAPTFNITRPMDLTAAGGKLPVIVWANGGCFRSDFSWNPLFEHWARAGFVVLSLTGTGGPDDLAGMLSQTSKAEHGALIDWLEKANAEGPLAGALDVDRVVAAGNSCGGVTALELTAEDKRVAAVFVLSGSSAVGSVNTQVMQAISVPVGYITGNASEDVAAPNAADDYEAMPAGIPALLMMRTSGDHITVSTDAMILPENAEIALNWLDLALYGTKQALDTLTAPDRVCGSCTPGVWKLTAKHLETLVK